MFDDVTWSDYPGEKSSFTDSSGIVVIRPRDWTEPIPLACPVCSFLYRSKEDEESHKTHQCCFRCSSEHLTTQTSREDWTNGWRPSDESVKESVLKRNRPTVNVPKL